MSDFTPRSKRQSQRSPNTNQTKHQLPSTPTQCLPPNSNSPLRQSDKATSRLSNTKLNASPGSNATSSDPQARTRAPTAGNGHSSPRTRATAVLECIALNPVDFAPFGEVIQNPVTHGGLPSLRSVGANQGSATKWLDVTAVTDFYDESSDAKAAKLVVNMFSCRPRELERRQRGGQVFPIEVLERHPYTAQTFIPLGVSSAETNVRYLVIVAPTLNDHSELVSPTPHTSARKASGPPNLKSVRAFVAKGNQAVTYGAGTWHAPMVVLGGKPIDFVVVQHSNGVALDDCQEYGLQDKDGSDRLVVRIEIVAAEKAKL